MKRLRTMDESSGGSVALVGVIDGRRRFKACEIAKKKPFFREVSVADPVAYALSLNLHRRHLSPAQIAMVGARARQHYDQQAKERQQESASKAGKASGASRRGETNDVENLPPRSEDAGKARDAVAKVVGVSGKSIDHATKVLAKGEPELVKAVDEGRMAISTAAATFTPDAIKRPKTSQRPRCVTVAS